MVSKIIRLITICAILCVISPIEADAAQFDLPNSPSKLPAAQIRELTPLVLDREPQKNVDLEISSQGVDQASLSLEVDITTDSVDVLPGDGLCSDAAGNCSLRASIMESNAHPGLDTILLIWENHYLTLTGSGEDQSFSGDLDILDPVIIRGINLERVRIDQERIAVYCSWDESCFDIRSDAALYHLQVSGSILASGLNSPIDVNINQVTLIEGGIQAFNTNLTIIGAEISDGNGVSVHESHLTVHNSNIRQNHGAGIAGWDSSIEVYNTTIASNFPSEEGISGGIHIYDGQLSVVNSTVYNNQSNLPGAGIYSEASNTSVLSSTIANNITAGQGLSGQGGGIAASGSGAVRLANTIVAENDALTGPDCSVLDGGMFLSEGYNLIGDSSGCAFIPNDGDLINVDPKFYGELADYGGANETIALDPSSPAVDTGDPAGCADMDNISLTIDQRYSSRVQDGDGNGLSRCDIGAVEMLPPDSPGLWQCTDQANPNACHDFLEVDMVSPDQGWAVGFNGSILHWNGSVWLPSGPANKTISWSGIDMLTPTEGWAVGYDIKSLSAVAAHWNGEDWSNFSLPGANFQGWLDVVTLGGNDAWAIDLDRIWHWDGSLWSQVSNPITNTELNAIDDGWIVAAGWQPGEPAVVLRWNGSLWETIITPFLGYLWTVDANGPNDVWAAGETWDGKAAWLHWDGSDWTTGEWPFSDGTVTNAKFNQIQMVSSSEGWMIGTEYFGNGYLPKLFVLQYDGSEWLKVPTPPTSFGFIALASADDGWLFGDSILRWNGNNWITYQPSWGSRGDYELEIEMFGKDDIWISGSSITHWIGKNKTQYLAGEDEIVWDIDFLSPANGWAALGSGKVLHWEGLDWTTTGEPADFLDTIEAVSANDIWAAGSGIFHWNGTTWNESADVTHDVKDMEMLSYNNGWAVGNGIWRWDGQLWNSITELILPTWRFRSIDMLSSQDGWATGYKEDRSSLLLRWGGANWQEYPINTGFVGDIEMISENEGWIAGGSKSIKGGGPNDDGWLLYWDGQSWTEFARPVIGNLAALSFEPSGHGRAVGMGIQLQFIPNSKPTYSIFLPLLRR